MHCRQNRGAGDILSLESFVFDVSESSRTQEELEETADAASK